MGKEGINRAVIFIEQQGLRCVVDKESTPKDWKYPDNTMRHMEVTDSENFRKSLEVFLQEQKLTGYTIIVVFSPAFVFAQSLTGKTKEEKEAQEKEFHDVVPFERVAARTYKTAEGMQLLGINRDLYDTLRTPILKNDNHIVAVIPMHIAAIAPNTTASVILKNLFSKVETFKEESIVQERTLLKTFAQKQEEFSNKHKFLVIGVFLVFIAGLIAFTAFMLQVTAPKPTALPTPVPTRIPTPTPTTVVSTPPLASVAPSSAIPTATHAASIVRADTPIQVVNGSGVAGQAETVRQRLETEGFTQVRVENTVGVRRTGTLVVVAPTIDSATRERIVSVLSLLFSSVSIQENPELSREVIITTGQE